MSAATAQLLDGAALAATIKRDLAGHIERLKAQGITPGLGTILVGDDQPSATYVGLKHTDSREIGIASFAEHLPANASQSDVLAAIERFNTNPHIDAFLVQLPLPRGLDEAHERIALGKRTRRRIEVRTIGVLGDQHGFVRRDSRAGAEQ